MAVAAVRKQPEQSTDERLVELAMLANTEFVALGVAVRTSLDHAMKLGAVLDDAYQLVPVEHWRAWVEENFHGSFDVACYCRRLHRYRDQLPNELVGVDAALKFLQAAGLELPRAWKFIDRNEVQALRRAGLTYREIADALGASQGAVWEVVNVGPARDRRRRLRKKSREAQKALERQEQERAAKRVGGDVSKAYSQYRLLAETLHTVIGRAPSKDAKREAEVALQSLYKCGDAINRAIAMWE